jgi:hypothetical protein
MFSDPDPEDWERVSLRNVGFQLNIDTADRPREFYNINAPWKFQILHRINLSDITSKFCIITTLESVNITHTHMFLAKSVDIMIWLQAKCQLLSPSGSVVIAP